MSLKIWVSVALYTVYISGDLSPNYANGSGQFSVVLFSTTTGYAGGAVNVNTNVSVPLYAYDDLSNYGTATLTINSGNTCAYGSISGFSAGAYVSDWGPSDLPSPSNSSTQAYSNGYYNISGVTPC
jgi:hypothetical protein